MFCTADVASAVRMPFRRQFSHLSFPSSVQCLINETFIIEVVETAKVGLKFPECNAAISVDGGISINVEAWT